MKFLRVKEKVNQVIYTLIDNLSKKRFFFLPFIFLLFSANTLFCQEEVFSFEELTGKVLPKGSDNPYKLRAEVYEAFLKMSEAAKKDNIQIEIVSGYRSFDHQERIYNRKYKKYTEQGLTPEAAIEKIIEYSTIPGTSRHHWGTDIDIIQNTIVKPKNLLIASNFEGNGLFCPLKEWMDTNASKFGFKLVYTNDPNRKGFKYEPWHYTYISTSEKMLNSYIKQDVIVKIFNNNLVKNRLKSKKFVNKYLKNNILDIF